MAEPILPDLITDPDEIAEIGYTSLEANIPGWNRIRADFMTILIAAHARMAAEARDVAADVPLAILRYQGQWVAQLPPVDAAAAQATATVTMADNQGYTIPAGTRFLIRTAGDDGHVFLTREPVTVLPGATVTGTGEVQLIADEPGLEASGLPDTSIIEPVDSLAYIASVDLTTATSGGVDAETDEEYVARLVEEFRLITGTPILPEDFAVLARRIPGVARALPLNGYNPDDASSGNERYITVAVTDQDGEALSAGVKNEVDALLQSLREVTFVVRVIDPTYSEIDVTTQVVTRPGFDVDTVEAAVAGALTAYLSPARWGSPLDSDEPSWVNEPVVRYLELTEVVNRVEGVHYIDTLEFALAGNPLDTDDVTITGPAALARAGDITVTAT